MNKRIMKKKGLAKITEEELWSLDVTIAKFILPRLIKYKTINAWSYPAQLSGTKEWHEIIDKMIWSFEYVIKHDFNKDTYKEDCDRYNEGMRLFAEHFTSLWD